VKEYQNEIRSTGTHSRGVGKIHLCDEDVGVPPILSYMEELWR
jgi:hypothetical protein